MEFLVGWFGDMAEKHVIYAGQPIFIGRIITTVVKTTAIMMYAKNVCHSDQKTVQNMWQKSKRNLKTTHTKSMSRKP
jgi:hypothetical protein